MDGEDSASLFRLQAVSATGQEFGEIANLNTRSDIITTLASIAVLVFGFGVSVFVEVPRRETIDGLLVPTTGQASIVSQKPGIVSKLYVTDGAFVSSGAPLFGLRLDPNMRGGGRLTEALASASQAQAKALHDQDIAQRLTFSKNLGELDEREDSLVKAKVALEAQLAIQDQRIGLAAKSLEAGRNLSKKGYFSDVQLRQREDAVLGAQQDRASLERQISENLSAQRELRATRSRLSAELARDEAQLRVLNSQVAERATTYDAEGDIMLTAPVSGRVTALNGKLGSNVEPGVVLATILPRGGLLEAQLWAPSRARGFLRPGEEVKIMYDAFPYQRFGVRRGWVRAVADVPTTPAQVSIPNDGREALYRVDVRLEQQAFDAFGQRILLPPGARLRADIVLERRSLFEWVLEPLYALGRRAS